MKKQLLFLVMFLLPLVASAYDIAVKNADGVTIYYNYTNGGLELEVTYLNKVYDQNRTTYSGSVTIPREVIYMNRTRKVTSIGDAAFAGCKDLNSLSIPNSINSIGKQAFYSCAFTKFVIPENVSHIGSGAFQYCLLMTDVTIPSSVTEIGGGAFYDCSGLTGVHISSIEDWCKIHFDMDYVGTNPTHYAHHLYINGSEVTDVIIPNSLTSINDGIFDGCSELASVTIPDGVTSIGKYSFNGCKKLTSITLPSGVVSIGDCAFQECSNLESINLPQKITTIGYSAFSGCEALKSIVIPDGVTEIMDATFYHCVNLASVILPNSLTSLGTQAFGDCSSLESIIIPRNVTNISQFAFQNCSSLTSINLPKNLVEIGMNAFQNVDLMTITSLIEEPFPIKWNMNDYIHVFSDNTIMNATLYVPKGTINKYKETEGWKDFVFIEEMKGEQCKVPTISYENGKLTFSSETDGAICHYSISDEDIKTGRGNEVQLNATYTISVYATKEGCENSELATATLCWIDALPKTEGITNGVAQIAARPVLIKTDNGFVTVEGIDDRTDVSVFTADGKLAATAVSHGNIATIATSIQFGSIAIVKVGEKSIKVVMK
ncbi:leucine-rich repeat domain-containing protein [Prevotella communis]|uniref:leucine-rich repeat domain-containing protein n=1 Tax=Prevotella communis TaxID=2913614 RepID=UPI001ED9FD53|nr:leucine-rich repeat domain-containing protein [Prevotella communis]UKK61349.1 leucine-rich repeat domain-containing protein [Prevotella communis]UKK64174.1 leucine-rich repeat domain-containing protein [Prevotella communis]